MDRNFCFNTNLDWPWTLLYNKFILTEIENYMGVQNKTGTDYNNSEKDRWCHKASGRCGARQSNMALYFVKILTKRSIIAVQG